MVQQPTGPLRTPRIRMLTSAGAAPGPPYCTVAVPLILGWYSQWNL